MMELIDRFEWDEWNIAHIARHGMSVEEVESVVSRPVVATASYKERLLLIGPSAQDRLVAVVAGRVPDTEGTWYVFTASPASRKERRRYAELTARETL